MPSKRSVNSFPTTSVWSASSLLILSIRLCDVSVSVRSPVFLSVRRSNLLTACLPLFISVRCLFFLLSINVCLFACLLLSVYQYVYLSSEGRTRSLLSPPVIIINMTTDPVCSINTSHISETNKEGTVTAIQNCIMRSKSYCV